MLYLIPSNEQILPLLIVRHSSKLSSYVIYRKINEPNKRKSQKKPNFGLFWRKFCSKFVAAIVVVVVVVADFAATRN